MSKVKQYIFNDKFVPILLAIIVIISYGLLIPFQGIAMDDWYILWFKHTFGALQFPAYYALDRPFMGYLYTVVSLLLGNAEQPVIWLLFALLCRWVVSISLWQMLKTIWPNARRQVLWVTLLATVFPGFTQHWFPVQSWFYYLCLAGFFFSITLMIKALEDRKRFWFYYIGSVLIAGYCMIASEFFLGLELTRIAILWVWFSRSKAGFKSYLAKTFQYAGIFLAIFLFYSIWRGFFFVSINHSATIVKELTSSPLGFVKNSLSYLYYSTINSTVNSWIIPFHRSVFPSKGIVVWLIGAIMIGLLAVLLIWQFIFQRRDPGMTPATDKSWRREAFLISGFSLVVSIFPFWSAGLPVTYAYPYDRFLLAFIFGSCLLIVAILELFGGRLVPSTVLISLLVAVCAGYQFYKSYNYKTIWAAQKNLYWQIVWRMPNIAPGTAVMAYSLPSEEYFSGQALTAQLNWTLSDGAPDRKTSYEFLLLDTPQINYLPSFKPDQPYRVDFRTYQFDGNTSNSILINYEVPGCLRVVDSDMNPLNSVTGSTNYISIAAAKLSNPSLIKSLESTTFHPPYQILGKEPAHDWCFYFEKADLAIQQKDYPTVLDLFAEAQAKGLGPSKETEWYPFIRAFAQSGAWQKAADLTTSLDYAANSVLRSGLCHTWQGFDKAGFSDPTIHSVLESLNCGQ